MGLVYVAFAFVVASISAVQVVKARGDFMAAPLGLFGFGVALVHGFMPALELGFDLRRFGEFSIAAHLSTLGLAFATLVAAAVGVKVASPVRQAELSTAPSPRDDTLWFLVLIAIPGLYASYWLRQRFGLADVQVMQDRINAMADASFFLLLSGVVAVVPAYSLLRRRELRSRPTEFLISVILIAGISYLILMTGSRNTVFIAIVCWFVALQTTTASVSDRTLAKFRGMQVAAVTLMLVAGVGLAVFQEVRQLAVMGRTSTSISELVRVENIVDGLAWNFGNHQGALWIMEDEDDPKLYGETYLAGLVILVPRSVWPDKPLGAGPMLKNMIQPGSYVIGRRGISSYTTGLVAEGLMNFSIIGPPLVGFIAGVWMAVFRTRFYASRSTLMRVAYCYGMISVCVTLLYSEFAGWFGRSIVVIGMLVLAALISSLRAPMQPRQRVSELASRDARS